MVFACFQRILDSEAAEGIKTTLDRKTVSRLLQKLLRFGLINVHFVMLASSSNPAKIYTHTSVEHDSEQVKTIERELQTKAELLQRVENSADREANEVDTETNASGGIVLVSHMQYCQTTCTHMIVYLYCNVCNIVLP